MVNNAGVCDVEEMYGVKPSHRANAKLAGADHEKQERAVPALAGGKMACTSSRNTNSCDQVQSQRKGRASLCARRDVVTRRSARFVLLQAR